MKIPWAISFSVYQLSRLIFSFQGHRKIHLFMSSKWALLCNPLQSTTYIFQKRLELPWDAEFERRFLCGNSIVSIRVPSNLMDQGTSLPFRFHPWLNLGCKCQFVPHSYCEVSRCNPNHLAGMIHFLISSLSSGPPSEIGLFLATFKDF